MEVPAPGVDDSQGRGVADYEVEAQVVRPGECAGVGRAVHRDLWRNPKP